MKDNQRGYALLVSIVALGIVATLSGLLVVATQADARRSLTARTDLQAHYVAEAGITKPILYSHFGDKAGLAAALTERVAAELDRTLVASMSKVQSPEQVVSSTIDAFCSFVETETELYHFLWYAAMNQSDRSGAKLLIAGFADQIAFTLGSALRQVGEDSGAAEPWAYAIVGMTLTAGEWWLARRTMTRDDLVSYLTRLLWGGLAGAGLDRLSAVFDPLNPSAANVTLLPPAAGSDT